MPPRPLWHDLRVMRLLSCALLALLPALSTHAQSPAPAKPAAAPKPAAAAAKVEAAPATPKAPAPTQTAATPTKPAAKTPPTKPVAVATALTVQDEVRQTFKDKIVPFVKTYCYECHGDRRMKGGVTFHPALKNPSDPAYIRRWKMGLATVHAHDMPPDDADNQPTDPEREAFMAWVGRLKFLSPRDPGAFVIRRLTKTEYGNTLHDLLGVSPDVVAELPDEVPGEGYLNTLSPLQMEQYLSIANEAIARAFPPPRGPATLTQIDTRQRLFDLQPAPTLDATAAEYRAAARQVAQKLTRSAYRRPATEHEINVLMQVYDLAIKNKLTYDEARRLMLKATLVSPQFLYITPAAEAASSSSSSSSSNSDPAATVTSAHPPAPHSLAKNSPSATSPAPSAGTAPLTPATPLPPLPEILPLDDWMLASRLSYFLWATMPDAELSTLADQGKLHDPAVLKTQVARMLKDDRSRALFDGFGAQWLGLADLADKTFDTTLFPQMTPALRQAMYDEARLFFTSIIRENAPVTTFITADYTYLNAPLAALYGADTIGDIALPTSAGQGGEGSKKTYFMRLFGKKKAGEKDAVPAKGGPDSSVPAASPPKKARPAALPAPAASPQPATTITTASAGTGTVDATPAAAALPSGGEAQRPGSTPGTEFHRVQFKDPNRGGILGMPGILATTSFPNRTSPVKRGVWVLEQILGEHIPPAPPNVPTLEKQDKKKIANLTLRQRTELHRTNVVCANCHKILDPIGFGLENFDAIGRWRDQDDTGGPIDAAGELPGGKHFSTPAQLKAILALRKDDLTRTLTEKLLAYALCRQLEGYDEIIIDQLMSGIAKDGHRMQPLITSIITSYPFLNRRVVETLSAPAPSAKSAPAKK